MRKLSRASALLGALLLFSNFSSYLVQARLRTLADRADSIAKTTALEIQRAGSRDMEGIVAQREMAATREFEGASIAVVEMRRACSELPPPRPPQTADSQPSTGDQRTPVASPLVAAGPWAHVEVPAAVLEDVGHRPDVDPLVGRHLHHPRHGVPGHVQPGDPPDAVP